ncbi:UDP-glycosyltransferase UGT5-like [Bemisia tabaci]|uniref:UDP-glycosyltransferase UGT5-like n=1 Tax=Bemisia tabaci TaxID=7038 RepID=UPI003B27E42A
MNIKPTGELPQDLKEFLDEATDGFIYVSFGSYIDGKLLSQRFKTIFIQALRETNRRVVMRWSDTIEAAPHILTKSWWPQQNILAHPNCKLFITHGGFNSLMEAMSIGVPTLGLPFFSDQRRNVVWYREHGIGLQIDYEDETVSSMVEKINTIIRTPSFMENAKRIAELYQDEPRSRLDNAVYWVEYVIRHKGAHHLKPASVKIPYHQYLLLDVIAFFILIFCAIIYSGYYAIRKIALFLAGTEYKPEAKKQL